MELWIGVDCEEVARFEGILKDEPLLKKLFTQREIGYCTKKANPTQHLAARFAGKEAVLKAFHSAGWKISLNEIEIVNDEKGLPIANLLQDGMVGVEVKLSLSHSKTIAVAFAVVTRTV